MKDFQLNAIAAVSNSSRRVRAVLLTAAMLLAAPFSWAQGASGAPPARLGVAVAERFPSGSIQTVETAEIALGDVGKERVLIEEQYSNAERACYPKFFTTYCMDKAKEERREALALIRPVEVEANALKRRARVADRDKALAEKRADEEADAAQRAARQKEKEASDAKKAATVPPAAKVAPALDRTAAHEARIKRQQEEDAVSASKRAANVAAFENKVKAAEARQQEVATKKAEKAKERAEKEAAKKAEEKEEAARKAAAVKP